MTFEIACEKIFNSAKRRFDYLKYEECFIGALGTEKGSMLASNIVRETLLGLADGGAIEDVVSGLNAQLACLGLKADVDSQCRMISMMAEKERSAFTMLRVYRQMGMGIDEAFAAVKNDLSQGCRQPTDADREFLENQCLSAIIDSAKKSIPSFDECLKLELLKRPSNAARRLDTIVRIALGFFSAVEDVPLESVRDYLVGMMEPETEPSWLAEFLHDVKSSVGKELCAMNAMNIAWEQMLPMDEMLRAIQYRLEH